jgi:hypothetical protein
MRSGKFFEVRGSSELVVGYPKFLVTSGRRDPGSVDLLVEHPDRSIDAYFLTRDEARSLKIALATIMEETA